MITPIALENENVLIHSFRPEDLNHLHDLATDVLAILSDDYTLRYLPGKRLKTLDESKTFLRAMLLNFHAGRKYLHFIRDKKQDKVIGLIDIISPALAREHYQIPHYPFFIEFYLGSFAAGTSMMSIILPEAIKQLADQGIDTVGAVVNRKNIAAKKVLQKAGFLKKRQFDVLQDYYETEVS